MRRRLIRFGLALLAVCFFAEAPAAENPPVDPHQAIDVENLSGVVHTKSKVDEKLLAEFGGIAKASQMAVDDSAGCLSCHQGVEEMHVGFPLSCVYCHGGDNSVVLPEGERRRAPYSDLYLELSEKAHVHRKQPRIADRRVLPVDYDLEYYRFVNPTNLRVVEKVCGNCHVETVADLPKSLHATSAGHYNGGLYLMGVTPDKTPRYGVFPVEDNDGNIPPGALQQIVSLPALDVNNTDITKVEEIYKDVPRKQCTACHLYSSGVGVRGTLGREGWYRSEGCSACHTLYDDNGLSRSGDPTINKLEPGHPIAHRMTSAVPTNQCVHCHVRGARIGLNFQGLAQLPPGVPAGPTVPNTTKFRTHGQFFLKDPEINPADLHHTAGMHCIDCHTLTDVMGDGNIFGVKELAIEIECEDCHGTLEEDSTFFGSRGTLLRNLSRKPDGTVVLTSKVTGKEHVVKQVRQVVNADSPDFNERAQLAMTGEHCKNEGGLECYACHSSWAPNCFGCHYQFNKQFTQLDMIAGERTEGQTQLNEFVFTQFRPYYIGINSEGKVAPYSVGCLTMTTVFDEDGKQLTDLKMPRTAAGLSGLSMNPRQPHTVTRFARQCVECHRSAQALGLGSENFQLFRQHIFAVGDRGLQVLQVGGLNRKTMAGGTVVGQLALGGKSQAVALVCDDVTFESQYAYVADAQAGLRIIDVHDPAKPRLLGTVETYNARDVAVIPGYAFVADDTQGVRVINIEDPLRPFEVTRVDTVEARAIKVYGIYAYVADGPAGVCIIDVSEPTTSHVVSSLDLNGQNDPRPNHANELVLYTSFSKPLPAQNSRTIGREILYVADGYAGLRVVDVSHPEAPQVVATAALGGQQNYATGLDFTTIFELGSFAGKIPSLERDTLILIYKERDNRYARGFITGYDVNDPLNPRRMTSIQLGGDPNRVTIVATFLAPFLNYFALVSADSGASVRVVNISDRRTYVRPANYSLGAIRDIALEVLSMDRLVEEDGRQVRDTAHEGARPFNREELHRILHAPIVHPYQPGQKVPPSSIKLAQQWLQSQASKQEPVK